MKYQSITALDNRVEKIIDRTVKFYYTDWKNYDRPKYMRYKGSQDLEDKKMILIARECGTYLVKISDIQSGGEWANALIDHYSINEHSDFYYINLLSLECKKVAPEEIKNIA